MADDSQKSPRRATSASPKRKNMDEPSKFAESGTRETPKRQKLDVKSGRERQGSERGGRAKKRNMGRAEYNRSSVDRRARNEQDRQAQQPGRGEVGEVEKPAPIYTTKFSKEDIEADPRKPKSKVAVMMGYSGSGYKGMQLNSSQRTIEGDLFGAFVRAGAISKANADDPKKSSLVRCARTDKGVHAAGNVISLKLIIEDPKIVEKINAELPSQIRVFGISRVNGGFSAYQLCDSRIYEYLIPTHCFLPPHPDSFLARKLIELADEAGDSEGYRTRQEEVSSFWTRAEREYIEPLLNRVDPSMLQLVKRALHQTADMKITKASSQGTEGASSQQESVEGPSDQSVLPRIPENIEPIVRELKSAYLLAKQAYRIPTSRIDRLSAALGFFVGTHNFHNYTVNKTARDPSAHRVMKSIKLEKSPKLINGTEWLSIKIHGQSFMMHQIRKMISTAAMIVRCGVDPQKVIPLTFGRERLSVPKAPGLGLLLERPVFDAYNDKKLVGEFGREPVGFTKYEIEMEDFKQKEIYDRIWREEAEGNVFHGYFASVDNLYSSQLLYLTSMGMEAVQRGLEGDELIKPSGGGVAQAVDIAGNSEEELDEAVDG